MARYYSLLLALLCCLSACQNGEDMGELYGMWRLETIHTQQKDVHPTDLYLCFQSNVVEAKEVNDRSHGYVDLFGTVHQEADVLTMSFVEINPSVVTCQYLLGKRFCFPEQDPLVLTIRQLDGTTLTLRDGDMEWQFVKY